MGNICLEESENVTSFLAKNHSVIYNDFWNELVKEAPVVRGEDIQKERCVFIEEVSNGIY